MSRAAVIYFSQNGTTARVAQAIASGLRGAGCVVDTFNLRDGPPAKLAGYDLLGIGSPVYYYRLPFNVTDYLRTLPSLEGRAAFCFLVYGSHAFDTASSLCRALLRKGATEVGCFRCRGAAYFLGHLREGYLFSPDHPTPSELDRAGAFGAAVAARCASGESAAVEDEPGPPFVYRLERAVTSRWLVEQVYSRLFRVDTARCTACGDCMAICPTGNIGKNERGQPQWGRNCLYCLSCELTCPEDAIRSVVSRPVFRTLVRPLLRYNIRHWTREGDVDYVQVVHRRGRTVRLAGKSAGTSAGR